MCQRQQVSTGYEARHIEQSGIDRVVAKEVEG